MEKLTYIAVHNTGGIGSDPYAKSQHLTWQDVNNAHKVRWPGFKSSLGLHGGYNFYIPKEGGYTQFRALGEETAAQIGHNKDTVSICLAGNFSAGIEKPTEAQVITMRQIIDHLLNKSYSVFKVVPETQLDLSVVRIFPHRLLQDTKPTNCYGSSLSNTWARDVILEHLSKKLTLLQEIMVKMNELTLLFDRYKSLGKVGGGYGCAGRH